MSDGGTSGNDLIRLWLDRQAGALGADAERAAWDRAEALFRAWSRFTEVLGPGAMASASPFDPAEWLKPEGEAGMAVLQGLLSGAGLGDLAGVAGAGPRGDDWRTYAAALDRYRAITGAAWLAAFREFAERTRRDAEDARRHGTEPPGWDDLGRLWQAIADREFAATQRSAEFLEAQAALMRAGLDCRRRVRERVEALAGLLDLPTRAEVDDMAEAIDALRREIRALRAAR